MSKTPKEIWCSSGLYYDYVTDWSNGSWCRDNDGGVKYVRADHIEELKAKLAKALEWAEKVRQYAISMDDRYLFERAATTLAELKGEDRG